MANSSFFDTPSPGGSLDWAEWCATPIDPQIDVQASANLQTPCVRAISDPEAVSQVSGTNGSRSSRAGYLPFVNLEDWSATAAYSERPPIYIHYRWQWFIKVNNRQIATETDGNVVLAPGDYFVHKLRDRIANEIRHRTPEDKICEPADHSVTVSVNDRGEDNFIKCSAGHDIDWPAVESQLRSWCRLFQSGKKLQLKLSLNFKQAAVTQGPTVGGRSGPAGRSTTSRMLNELNMQLGAEEAATGLPALWKRIYEFFRCPGECENSEGYCWQDPVTKKHIRLTAKPMEGIVDHVRAGGELSHTAIPDYIRQHLINANKQQPRSTKLVRSELPPIHIHNHFPSQSSPSSVLHDTGYASATVAPLDLCVPWGPGEALRRYFIFLISSEDREDMKEQYRKAENVCMKRGFDLVQMNARKNVKCLEDEEIEQGVAWNCMYKIELWVKTLDNASHVTDQHQSSI